MTRRLRLRKKQSWLTLLVILLSWGLYYAEQAGWIGEASQVAESNQPGLYSIASFVDGDTIAVNMNGKVEKVRLVGIDTPETHKPNTPVQCYGPAAAAFTKNTIGKNRVRLVADSLSTNRDRYDRLLRYVYLPDGTNFNQKLVQNGYAFYYPHFPFTKSAEFAADQAAAMAAGKGLWGNCAPTKTYRGGYISNPQT